MSHRRRADCSAFLRWLFDDPALCGAGQASLPIGEWIIDLASGAGRWFEDAGGVQEPGDRLLPQIAMLRQLRVVDAEGGHERGVVGGQEAGVNAQVRVGGGQPLRVVVGGGCSRTLGVIHQRALELVWNHAQFVAAHMDQRVHARLDAHGVGGGNKVPVGGQTHLVSAGNDPLDIGGGEVGAQPDGARA